MTNFLKRLVIVFFSTYVVILMSEHIFWSKPGDDFAAIFRHLNPWHWRFYFIVTYSLLSIVSWFKVRDIWAMFLAGAAYGWLIEGVIVSTTYDDLPHSISVTGLSWHATLSVCVMWYFMRHALISKNWLKTALASCGIGIFWATWGIWWWIERGEVQPLNLWVPYVFILSAALALAYWVLNKVPGDSFQPTKVETVVLAFMLTAWFIATVVPKKPVALFLLPVLLAVVYVSLDRNRLSEKRPSALVALQGKTLWYNYCLLALIPITASLLYALYHRLGVQIRTGPPIYVILEYVGYIMFIASCVMMFLRKADIQEA